MRNIFNSKIYLKVIFEPKVYLNYFQQYKSTFNPSPIFLFKDEYLKPLFNFPNTFNTK